MLGPHIKGWGPLIGHNMEVSVHDLAQSFAILRKYQIKLNPTKCAFGIRSGKFLGLMVSQRGIEAKPDKIRAVMGMAEPTSIKEVQRLTSRIIALGLFMSRAGDKCLPFFNSLKKAFKWTPECREAFLELKR
ncbi:uncharacterized mitochondrial protein AtMg00860-like [Rutidosis leptorrhynchoides]|uniref:uncharacterized mitochondrial protein AtMg00860-like n=1 Tax=Rutidosis leptorrhynchoides TaxID=125765 RepID=UPI003A9A180C